eukprot:6469910-Amphidinium_carterae.3
MILPCARGPVECLQLARYIGLQNSGNMRSIKAASRAHSRWAIPRKARPYTRKEGTGSHHNC